MGEGKLNESYTPGASRDSQGVSRRPVISVVIPTYHRNDLLTKCLMCLAPDKQTLDASLYEVIVSDDGKESTAENLIAENFPWAKWVKGPGKGPASNRNHGVSHTRGVWVAFTDDDCLPDEQWLSGFYSAIADGRNVLEGKTTCSEGINSPLFIAPINETGGALWSCNIMVRRTFFDRVQGFDESFPWPHLEDVDFRERVYGSGETVTFVAEALIDHPPRPAHFGKRLGAMQETEFLFYYKTGHHKRYLLQHLRRMISLRALLILKYPIGGDSVRVLLSLVPELLYVMQHGNAWQKHYQEKYRDVNIPYPPDLVVRCCQH
jgi:GT2 family glycosyltransferase